MFSGKRNLIFDLGGVLLDIKPEATFKALAAMGMDPAMLVEAECMQNSVLHEFEKGRATEEDVLDYILGELPQEVRSNDIAEVKALAMEAWCAMLGNPVVEKFEAIETLREQGYRTYLLSNTNITHWAEVEEKLLEATGKRPEEFFDRIFLSFEMGMRKPDEAIFRQVLCDAGIEAAETLFFDDAPENCEAARSVGIDARVVQRNDSWDNMIGGNGDNN